MKHIFSFAFVSLSVGLWATSAFAWPSAGDSVTYTVTNTASGSTATTGGTVQVTTQSIDTTKDQMVIVETATQDGQTQTQQSVAKLSDFAASAKQVPQIIAACAQQGGTIEVLTTPAGNFNSCKMADTDSEGNAGFVWVADVVFGLAKETHTDAKGGTTTVVLNSFTSGK